MKTIKRIISIIIDLLILSLTIKYTAGILIDFIVKDHTINLILNMAVVIIGLYLFIYKDCIWGYESIGKKLMGLKIYQNGKRVIDKKLLIQRIKTTYLYAFISVPMLVLSGKTEADMKYNTEVK